MRNILTWTAAVVLLALSSPRAARAEPSGHVAPSFTVRGIDGRSLRFSDFKGRALILDFWATWCGPCRATIPHLNQLQERFAGQGLVVVGLSVDEEDAQSLRRFADRMGVKFRLGVADERVLDQYGPIRSIPTTFFISRRGTVLRRVVGYIDPETLEQYARELF